MSSCALVTDLGLVRDVLTAVDCNTRGFAQGAYVSLTLAGSPFQTALTLLLTVYVAVLGYRLFFARGSVTLSDGPGIVLKIGALLTLLTSWSVFQTLVFDMASRAPVEIARAITMPLRASDGFAADPIAGLQAGYDQLSAAAAAFAKPATANATAARTLGLASNNLFVASAGLVAVLTVAIGVLTAIGPIFIALFLFPQTRGFFTGWVRALSAAAFGLLSTWTLTVLTLHALGPWLSALSQRNDAETGITASVIVFIFAASQAALLLAGFAIARGFRLNLEQKTQPKTPEIGTNPLPVQPISRPARLAEQLQPRDEVFSFNRTATFATTTRLRTEPPMTTPRHLGDLYRRPVMASPVRGRQE